MRFPTHTHTARTCIRTARKGSYRIRNVVSSAGVFCFFDCTHHRWRTTTGPARRRAQRERAVPHVVRRSHERTPLLQCPSARDLHRLLVRSGRTAHSTPSIPSTPSAPGDHPRRSSARKGSSSTFRGHRPRRRPTRGTRTSSAPRGHCRHSSSHSRPWQPSPCAVPLTRDRSQTAAPRTQCVSRSSELRCRPATPAPASSARCCIAPVT